MLLKQVELEYRKRSSGLVVNTRGNTFRAPFRYDGTERGEFELITRVLDHNFKSGRDRI